MEICKTVMKKTVIVKCILLWCALIFIVMLSGCKDLAKRADDLRLDNKFEEAARMYSQAANEGNSYAKWRLANAYNNGEGVEFDENKAWTLLNEAANAGCPQAISDVALSYIYGWYGIDKDVEKGKAMLENLCKNTHDTYSLARYASELLEGPIFEKDEDKAMSILNNVKDKNEPFYLLEMAYIYFKGTKNIDVDNDKAVVFLKQAYKEGSGRAAWSIGDLYLDDAPPFKRDIAKAVDWYEKGCKRCNTGSMRALASICLAEDSTYSNWHSVDRGIALLEKAGFHGDGDAYAELGSMYGYGNKVYKDEEKSFDYYNKAYELRSAWGTNNLAACYIDGTACEKNIDKAIELFKLSSEWGCGKASENLYEYYYNPYRFSIHEINDELAKKYLLISVKQGSVDGNLAIGAHYFKGTNLFEKNLYKAFDYFKQAADMGNVNACEAVAYMLENGIGCERNPNKSKEYADKTKPKDTENTENTEDKEDK